MSLPTRDTLISTLRLRGRPVDPLVTRLRLTSMLSTVEFAPTGLPTTAIVVIRTLRDPMPGRWQFQRVGHGFPCAWQEALRQRVNTLARAAARPARGYVPESAEAVWFSDRGELLACLARDWCGGVVTVRWWWRSLLRDPDIARAVVAEWLQSPEYAPAALQQLAASGQATTFVRCLDERVVIQLLECVVERFGLVSLGRVLSNQAHAAADFGANPSVMPPLIPWLPWVPEVIEANLTRLQVNLLGITLLLQRAPEVVRSATLAMNDHTVDRFFISSFADLASNSGLQKHQPPPAAVIDRQKHQPSSAAEDRRRKTTASVQQSAPITDVYPQPSSNAKAKVRKTRTDAEHASPPSNNGKAKVRKVQTNAEHTSQLPTSGASVVVPHQPLGNEPPRLTARPPEQTSQRPAQGLMNSTTPVSDVSPGLQEICWTETEYGGALFLVNLGLFLDLYGDFSQPAKPGIELPIWDFVALLGEALTGEDIRLDPLWALLADLTGRSVEEAPGLHFRPALDWRMPVGWLNPFAKDHQWAWSRRSNRLQVWHPAGFCVLDLRGTGRDSEDALDVELAPYRSANLCADVTHCSAPSSVLGLKRAHMVPPALRRWCRWLAPYVYVRLAKALGTTAGEALGSLVCRLPARLCVTPTHLDAHFALADLPIEIRLAGLDRDPGWLPAAGRYVRFHFE